VFVDNDIDGVVNARTALSACAIDRAFELRTIGSEFREYLHVRVERDDHHLVVNAKLIDEADRRVLNIAKLKLC